jgi:hypothetical protein
MEDENIKLEKQGDCLVLTDGKGRQILLTDYGDEIGIWFKFLKKEIRVPKLHFIRHLFKD